MPKGQSVYDKVSRTRAAQTPPISQFGVTPQPRRTTIRALYGGVHSDSGARALLVDGRARWHVAQA
eukprot:6267672-Prymnesium_polylepis.1